MRFASRRTVLDWTHTPPPRRYEVFPVIRLRPTMAVGPPVTRGAPPWLPPRSAWPPVIVKPSRVAAVPMMPTTEEFHAAGQLTVVTDATGSCAVKVSFQPPCSTTLLLIRRLSTYVPAATRMVSPAAAAVRAPLIVLPQPLPPPGLTQRVAARAVFAPVNASRARITDARQRPDRPYLWVDMLTSCPFAATKEKARSKGRMCCILPLPASGFSVDLGVDEERDGRGRGRPRNRPFVRCRWSCSCSWAPCGSRSRPAPGCPR